MAPEGTLAHQSGDLANHVRERQLAVEVVDARLQPVLRVDVGGHALGAGGVRWLVDAGERGREVGGGQSEELF